MSFIADSFPKRIFNLYWPNVSSGPTPPSGLIIYFASDNDPQGIVTGPPVPERAAFEARLTGSGYTSEGFESYPLGSSASIAISMNGAACVAENVWFEPNFPCPTENTTTFLANIDDQNTNARFNTTPGGSKYLEFQTFDGDEASILPSCLTGPAPDRLIGRFVFSTNVAAFGFYGTDWGDFSNTGIGVTIVDENDVETFYEVYPGLETQGNLIFWGFVDDSGLTYKEVRFETPPGVYSALNQVDVLGIDDLIFCTGAYITTPPP